jgi:hypothetical protein
MTDSWYNTKVNYNFATGMPTGKLVTNTTKDADYDDIAGLTAMLFTTTTANAETDYSVCAVKGNCAAVRFCGANALYA